jgi:hypothetical protein
MGLHWWRIQQAEVKGCHSLITAEWDRVRRLNQKTSSSSCQLPPRIAVSCIAFFCCSVMCVALPSCSVPFRFESSVSILQTHTRHLLTVRTRTASRVISILRSYLCHDVNNKGGPPGERMSSSAPPLLVLIMLPVVTRVSVSP